MPDTNLAQLRLFQLISPTLPIGAFTYSQGMEWAVEQHWIHNEKSLTDWLESLLSDALCYLELPLLIRLFTTARDEDDNAFLHWSRYILASRETSELRAEEQQRARALLRVLQHIATPEQQARLTRHGPALRYSQSAGLALAAHHWSLSLSQLLLGFCWSWLENAVSVAVKLVPLGQSDGQKVLFTLAQGIPDVLQASLLVEDDELGASNPALAIASAQHETQYTRLFRS